MAPVYAAATGRGVWTGLVLVRIDAEEFEYQRAARYPEKVDTDQTAKVGQ